MGIVKVNADLFAAKVKNGSFESLKDKYGSTADMLLDVLNSCGSNVKSFYHPPSEAYHSGEANLAYLLDNYYEHALKFNGCDVSIMQLLQGSLAIVFIESNNPLGGGHWFDIWNGQGLSFTDRTTLAEFGGKRVWVWAMGKAAKAKAKHQTHGHSHGHAKHKAIHIF